MFRSLFFLLSVAGIGQTVDPIAPSPRALATLVQPAPDPAMPTLDAGKPVTAAVGKKCVVEVATTAKKVTWRIPPGVDSIPLDGKRLAVWALPGSYTLIAQVPAGDDVLSVDITLTITGSVGPPPPTDALTAAAKVAFASEPAATRDADKASLVAVYRASAKGLDSAKTAGDVYAIIHGATTQLINDRMSATRKVLNAEFAKAMPAKENDVLTDAHKATAVSLLTTYADILEGVK